MDKSLADMNKSELLSLKESVEQQLELIDTKIYKKKIDNPQILELKKKWENLYDRVINSKKTRTVNISLPLTLVLEYEAEYGSRYVEDLLYPVLAVKINNIDGLPESQLKVLEDLRNKLEKIISYSQIYSAFFSEAKKNFDNFVAEQENIIMELEKYNCSLEDF